MIQMITLAKRTATKPNATLRRLSRVGGFEAAGGGAP